MLHSMGHEVSDPSPRGLKLQGDPRTNLLVRVCAAAVPQAAFGPLLRGALFVRGV